uniref:Uncharacterized protein n=1 Tax=Oryzias latipes TaxID=8090 RepID=A0A3P9HIP8_ORYLA
SPSPNLYFLLNFLCCCKSGMFFPLVPYESSMTSDLNPLQQVWDQLTQRLEDRSPPQNDLAELHAALVEEWNTFPQNIMRLVRRMRCCCQAVIVANGGNTHY